MLGTKRVEANLIKNALESRIIAHTEAVRHAKGIEKQIQVRSQHNIINLSF